MRTAKIRNPLWIRAILTPSVAYSGMIPVTYVSRSTPPRSKGLSLTRSVGRVVGIKWTYRLARVDANAREGQCLHRNSVTATRCI